MKKIRSNAETPCAQVSSYSIGLLKKDITEKQVPVKPKPIVGILSKIFHFMHEVLLADSSGVAMSLRSLGTSFSEEAPIFYRGAPC